MLVDDFRDNREAEPHAGGLGGEKRIEDAFQMFGIDSGTAIDDRNFYGAVELAGLHGDAPAGRAGLSGIEQEIVYFPLDQLTIEEKGRNGGRVILVDGNIEVRN